MMAEHLTGHERALRGIRLMLLIGPLLAAGCAQPAVETSRTPVEVRTIENAPIERLPVEHTATLTEEVRPTGTAGKGQSPERTAAGEQEDSGASGSDDLTRRMDLPFAPAIAMDPVDGAKVSITPSTPVADFENNLYYFTSEQNRRAFLADPKKYLSAQLARY